MYVLGLSCFYHDAAVALLHNGEIIAAASEERFTRKKHDSRFPKAALSWALSHAGITVDQIEAVIFYDKPIRKFDRLLRSQLQSFPFSFKQFIDGMPIWFSTRLRLPKALKKEMGYTGPVLYSDHHLSHAASSFFTSGWDEAAVLTVDGVGEWSTATWGVGKGNDLEILGEIRFPHSLGLLYSAFTWYCGFKVNSAEYKLMGLAPYGEPTFVEQIRQLIEIAPDGSFNLDIDHFDFVKGTRMFNEKFEAVLGRPRRPLGDTEMDEHYKNVARSIQEVTNECMVKMAKNVLERTGQTKLCMAGGVALNCVANGHVLRDSGAEDIFIHPAAGDAGGAVGAAYLLWNSILDKPRTKRMPPPYFGPGYTDEEIREALDAAGAVYRRLSREALLGEVAGLIDSAHVVGWYQGRMEWGPRALGHRTILGDPRNPEMRDIINMKIKMREGFRPFAPTILEEHVKDYFVIDRPSPYMLLVADVAEGIELPAVTHVDNTARVQTINREQDALYYDLISEFKKQTSCPVIINTSMNVRGEPIVNTPEDAWLCFMRTHMDAIAIGPYLLLKRDQRELDLQTAEEAFGLD